MEALGAAASVIAIVEIVGRVSASAASFMHDIKDARKDMIQVRKDMSSLSALLGMVAEDLDHQGHSSSSRVGDMPHSKQHIINIANSCGAVLLEIETVLREGRSLFAWVTSGRERVDSLRARLETCKLSLDVALDYRTMVVVHDIKEDSTRIVGDLSAIQRDVALLLGKFDNIERKAAEAQRSADDAVDLPGGFMLDRFLNDCRSDAQTVLDNIEYQQDQDFEDDRPKAQAEASELAHEFSQEVKPEFASSSPSPKVLLKTSLGHEYNIPLEQCRTWPDMFEIIKCSYRHDPADTEEIENGRYTLYHDGQSVSPASWDDFVGPGRSVSLKLWKDEMIDLRDAVYRRFLLPWSMVNTWKGFEAILKQAFLPVEGVGPLVRQGRYDLIGPDDAFILPAAWEETVKPGMSIEMRMWACDEPVVTRLLGPYRKTFTGPGPDGGAHVSTSFNG
ncbi:hypothetical protein FJTKL_05635 [Diaporthe vaccinii]|uniref:Ubiquitin-like domain-containing protein n=1 Tax=Diaporthe vaccinii TaxID=105482 RepID=A0ABR4DRK5_9PEZI